MLPWCVGCPRGDVSNADSHRDHVCWPEQQYPNVAQIAGNVGTGLIAPILIAVDNLGEQKGGYRYLLRDEGERPLAVAHDVVSPMQIRPHRGHGTGRPDRSDRRDKDREEVRHGFAVLLGCVEPPKEAPPAIPEVMAPDFDAVLPKK